MKNARYSLKRNFASIFSKVREYEEECLLEEEKERNLDLVLNGAVEDISIEDFCCFFNNLAEYARVVHLSDPYMDTLEEKMEKVVGIRKERRVL